MTTREEYQARRKAWVEALRSGKYQQCASFLRNENFDGSYSHCCLGVACDISGLGFWEMPAGAIQYHADGHGRTGDLPPSVAEWFGLKTTDGALKYSEDLTNLADVNDNTDIGFEGIADLIEQRAADLFISEALDA